MNGLGFVTKLYLPKPIDEHVHFKISATQHPQKIGLGYASYTLNCGSVQLLILKVRKQYGQIRQIDGMTDRQTDTHTDR
jgi:hypothetical protein